jgi:hypothetical protein
MADGGSIDQGWRLAKYCAGLGANTVIQYKCKTTTVSPAKTTTTTAATTTSIPPCEVEEVRVDYFILSVFYVERNDRLERNAMRSWAIG